MNDEPSIREGQLLVGPLFSEPMQVETVRLSAPGTWILGLVGSRTPEFRRVTLTPVEFRLLRAVGFLMSLFQRRLASSSYALQRSLEKRAVRTQDLADSNAEAKLSKLKSLLECYGFYADPQKRLLIFTEFKDTLDYLMKRFRDWGFRDGAIQMLVATEAAGEGINLQCCHIRFNYDIPRNPNRLEQRMGRIHRYRQLKDCLIFRGRQVSDQSLETRQEATTLGRVHAAMLLFQASGRSNALRALLAAEIGRSPKFLRLANALAVLYPKGSEEERLVEAMLLAVAR
jgi:hypothetical protein